MDIRKHFQLASTLMQKNHYEEAREVLEILSSISEHSHIYWTLGLIEAQLGNLPNAIEHLEKVDSEQFPDVESIIVELKQKLPKYNTLMKKLTYADIQLNQNKIQDGINILEDIMSWRDKIPLPISFYRTYLTVLSKVNRELCIMKASELPLFVLNTNAIQSIPNLFNEHQQLLLPEKSTVDEDYDTDFEEYEEIEPPKKKSNKFRMVLVFGIILVCVYLFLNRQHIQKELASATKDVTTIQEENDALQEQLTKAQEMQEELQSQIDGTATQEVTTESESEVVELELQHISNAEAKQQYSSARNAFVNKEYETAITGYRQAILGETPDYYTDDAHYYLILSLMETGQYQEAINECNSFINNTSEIYTQSVYRNPASYMMAQCYINLNEKDQAITVLEGMQDQTEDWAVREARALLYELQNT